MWISDLFINICVHFIVSILSLLIGVKITSFAPKVLEVGKSAIIGCNIVYDEEEKYRRTALYVDKNNILINVYNYYFRKDSNFNPVMERTQIGATRDKRFDIEIKKLQYNDNIIFVCEANGGNSNFSNSQIKQLRIGIQNIKGKGLLILLVKIVFFILITQTSTCFCMVAVISLICACI